MFKVSGVIADVVNRRFIPGEISVADGRIIGIESSARIKGPFILPGLIDAHVHVESSMLVPSEFARAAVLHGSVASVSDPHEIANVLGMRGVDFMIENGRTVPFKFFFGAPSCVPATTFESGGAVLDSGDVEALLARPEVLYLSEMMNYPGVIHGDPGVMAKIQAARILGKPIDGHAPGLKGRELDLYAASGIGTDHECFTLDEAREKILRGIKIQIREGSAAKNFDALIPLLREAPDMVMFCSDDKHPDDLQDGHINELLKRAIGMGYDFFDSLRACTLNPVNHYGLDVGLVRPGDPADFILVDNLGDLNVLKVYIEGSVVAEHGKCLFPSVQVNPVNIFNARKLNPDQLATPARSEKIRVIEAYDGELITGSLVESALIGDGRVLSDPGRDILKLVVYNRYGVMDPAVGFIRGFGLKGCALASTVAHDSHNLIAIGTDDELLCEAINLLIEGNGGIAFVSPQVRELLPLPVAGIMSLLPAAAVADQYRKIDRLARDHGSALSAPFMTLSFMALLVIPALKLSDRGLFDAHKFSFTNLYLD